MNTLLESAPPRAAAGDCPISLPRDLRRDAQRMGWAAFTAHYGDTRTLRLGSWDASVARSDHFDYRATIGLGARIVSMQASALGPLAAATAMLHDLGASTEIIRVFQTRLDGQTVALVEAERDRRRHWGMGIDADPHRAGVAALVAATDKLL
ncbi:hypothetical protein [Williamsia sp. CHRR-6]|uniref:hypothetical protein n=1 Tax=Williamsia sp. CHRR-6 TaxID=2835871 RepID=UPI001BD922D2|nr:hypothetical protein [Williamsia sp. CHRR-6]MBT0567047.1 hypothetical protein [Williamsia sp. CHRR-6]